MRFLGAQSTQMKEVARMLSALQEEIVLCAERHETEAQQLLQCSAQMLKNKTEAMEHVSRWLTVCLWCCVFVVLFEYEYLVV